MSYLRRYMFSGGFTNQFSTHFFSGGKNIGLYKNFSSSSLEVQGWKNVSKTPSSGFFGKFSSISAMRAFMMAMKYRFGRMYYSFYYAQYTNKYVLVFLFPAFFFAVRFKHDTTLAYRIYMDSPSSDTLGSPTSYQAFVDSNQVGDNNASNDAPSSDISATSLPQNSLTSMFSSTFSQGTKLYMKNDATVEQLKRKVFPKASSSEYDKIQATCHGRILDDMDSLAFAVRAYCKRDPKIFFSKMVQ